MTYYSDDMCELHQGDCLNVMRTFSDNVFDTIITDPPYGLSFMGKKWDYDVPQVDVWKEALRVLKPGGTALIFAGSRTQHRMAVNVEDAGFILKDCIMWLYGSGFPKATDISKQLDKGHEREVIGIAGKSGSKRNSMAGDFEGGEYMQTNPVTPEAVLWNGWKSHGLKPAYEPIIVAMKPNEGSYANNAMQWGVSGLNIDAGRIDAEPELAKNWDRVQSKNQGIASTGLKDICLRDRVPSGRFPANVIHDGLNGEEWSRYFYCAKASKSERNAGCEGLEEKPFSMSGGGINAIARGEDEYGKKGQVGLDKISNRTNHHPTVKPLALMEYLCRLTSTPTGGSVLDPFCGSGTTGVAALNTGRTFTGIELDEEYCKIIKARLKNTVIPLEVAV